jgi:hypothetical protein
MEFLRSRSGDPPFSLRTAQRYMKLAGDNQSLEKLIKSSPSLRQAYQACGILPVPPEPEKPIIADREAVARIRLLKSVTSVQVKLRHFSDKKISLDDGTRKELLHAKTEIDRLFGSLMG